MARLAAFCMSLPITAPPVVSVVTKPILTGAACKEPATAAAARASRVRFILSP